MSLYDGIKDVAKIVQQADNIDLYRQLLDLSAQALDLQAENARLKEENAELKKKKELDARVVRHKDPYITLKDENPQLLYCSHCYDSEHVFVQLHCDYESSSFCPHCKTSAFFNVDEGTLSAESSDEDLSAFFSFDPYSG